MSSKFLHRIYAMILDKKIVVSLLFTCVMFVTGCSSKHVNLYSGTSSNQKNITSNVIRTAAKQIGRPYKLGGATPRTGFDCSGLIFWAYKQHGITVPRITTYQAKAGTRAPKNSLRPGDILVFKSSAAPNGLHTGVYMGGNKFLHAPNSRSRVKVEQLKGSYWGGQFIQARRIIGPAYARR